MKIIFFGTPEPAAETLKRIIADGHEICLVVTQPDRPKGRGQKVVFSTVKELALKHNLLIEQPERVKNNAVFKALIEALHADLAIVVAYGRILPADLLMIPKHGFINVHASILPKYRGAAPIQWAILNGEKETGITIMKVIEKLDAGDIIAQEKVAISDDDDAVSLAKKLFVVGAELLSRTLTQLEKGAIKSAPQNETGVTFAPSLTKESGEIDWRKSAVEINNRIRALKPWPVAHTFFQGKQLKILKAKIVGGKSELPGKIVAVEKQNGFVVATGAGTLLIAEVQPADGRPMSAYNFVLGHDVAVGKNLPS
jgi:methionyl-tRNA formyltransferase